MKEHFLESEEVNKQQVPSQRQLKNMYRILSSFAMVHGHEHIYNMCNSKIEPKKTLGEYRKASRRTDIKMRKLINLALQVAILLGSAQEAQTVL